MSIGHYFCRRATQTFRFLKSVQRDGFVESATGRRHRLTKRSEDQRHEAVSQRECRIREDRRGDDSVGGSLTLQDAGRGLVVVVAAPAANLRPVARADKGQPPIARTEPVSRPKTEGSAGVGVAPPDRPVPPPAASRALPKAVPVSCDRPNEAAHRASAR